MPRRFAWAWLGVLVACGSVDPRPEQEEARRAIRLATGIEDVHDPGRAPLDAAGRAAWLADGLTLDEALRLALLENRRLQAGFERLGVSKAELVQAGLWRDPTIGVGFLLPSGGGQAQWTFDLAVSVLDLWELPRREALAQAELAQDVLELARSAGELVAEVRAAYFAAVTAAERVELAREDADLARAERDAVLRRVEGGVARQADVLRAEALVAEAEQTRLSAELAAAGSRAALGALFSWTQDLALVPLVDSLPAPVEELASSEELVERSRGTRLDLSVSAQSLEAQRAALALERARIVPSAEVGVSAERPELGNEPDLLVGPGVSLGLPLSGAGRARASGAAYELAAREKEHEALLAEAAQAVRAAAARADTSARAALQAEQELVPRAAQLLVQVQTERSLGRAGLLEELAAERALRTARVTRLETRLAAALARSELERALGAPLGPRREPARGTVPRPR